MSKENDDLERARKWLEDRLRRGLKWNLRAFRDETGYDGPAIKSKGRVGQAAVAFRSEAQTSAPQKRRGELIKIADQQYIDAQIKMGMSEQEAMAALKQSKERTKAIERQRTQLNRERGPHSFSLGHETAANAGGGDFGRNVRLERGSGAGGNFSRGANAETPEFVKPMLGIPRGNGQGGTEAAIMDNSGAFDLGFNPRQRQTIKQLSHQGPDAVNDFVATLPQMKIPKGARGALAALPLVPAVMGIMEASQAAARGDHKEAGGILAETVAGEVPVIGDAFQSTPVADGTLTAARARQAQPQAKPNNFVNTVNSIDRVLTNPGKELKQLATKVAQPAADQITKTVAGIPSPQSIVKNANNTVMKILKNPMNELKYFLKIRK